MDGRSRPCRRWGGQRVGRCGERVGDIAARPYDGSDSVLELSPDTPAACSTSRRPRGRQDNAQDLDLSMAPALLPDGRVVMAGKAGIAYLLDGADLGGIGGQQASSAPPAPTTWTEAAPGGAPLPPLPERDRRRPGGSHAADPESGVELPDRGRTSHRGGRPGVDHGPGRHPLRPRPRPPVRCANRPPSACRPTTSRPRVSAAGCWWRRRPTGWWPSPHRRIGTDLPVPHHLRTGAPSGRLWRGERSAGRCGRRHCRGRGRGDRRRRRVARAAPPPAHSVGRPSGRRGVRYSADVRDPGARPSCRSPEPTASTSPSRWPVSAAACSS